MNNGDRHVPDINRRHMSYDQNGGGFGGPKKELIDVSAMGLKCAECGAAIDKLPFQPSADRPVYCQDCNRNRRKSSGSSRF